LGNLFHAIEDYEKAIFYHGKTLASRVERNDKKRTANSYNNIGICYLGLGDFIKASQFFKKSIAIFEAIETKAGLGSTLNNMGLTLQGQGIPAEAESYFQRALKEHKITASKRGTASSLSHLASVAFHQKQYRKSINFATKSLKIAKEIGSLVLEKNSYEWLAKSYETLKLYDESTAYYKAYNEASESLMGENKVKMS
jgi:tetratricopeptide (TPR) repeat protein